MSMYQRAIKRLREHLADDDATLNDGEVDFCYRLAHGLTAAAETDLETVEQWAFDIMTRRRPHAARAALARAEGGGA